MKDLRKWVGLGLLGMVLALGAGRPVLADEGSEEDGGVGSVLTVREKLQLTDEQVAGLQGIKSKAKAEIAPKVVAQLIDLAILKKKVAGGASDAELKPVLGRIALRHMAIEGAKGKYWGQAMALLNPTQQAKVVLVTTALYLDALKTVRQSWKERLGN